MGKFFLLKQKLISLGIILMVVLVTAGFSLVLGRYFLYSIVKSYPVGKTVYTKVYYQVELQKIRLDPVPIYTLQAGVFLDIQGAQEFANSLLEKGLRPYITPVSPFKVLIFTSSSREGLEKFKENSPDDVFVITEILNSQEVELPAQKKEWVDFLTEFTGLFSDSLVALNKNDSAGDKTLSERWIKLAVFLETQGTRGTNELIVDCRAMALMLNSPRITIQEQGENAKVILKAKYDFDTFRQILMHFS